MNADIKKIESLLCVIFYGLPIFFVLLDESTAVVAERGPIQRAIAKKTTPFECRRLLVGRRFRCICRQRDLLPSAS